MSCYGWERGTLVLPTAAVAPLKKTLREAANKLFTDVLAEAKAIHKATGTTATSKYRDAIDRVAPHLNSGGDFYGYGRPRDTYTPHVRDLARSFLISRTYGGWNQPAPTRMTVPTVADLEKFGVKRYTNKDNTFRVGEYGEASITFNGREVTWDVPENNHAVDNAHEAYLATVFFAELRKINWTRGTGGQFVGNDEYNRDDHYDGGGANYVTMQFGPLGTRPRTRYAFY